MVVQHTERVHTRADGSGTRAEASSLDNGAVVPSARTFTGSMAAYKTGQKVPVMAERMCALACTANMICVKHHLHHDKL